MAKFPSSATPVVLAGLAVASTVLLAFIWRQTLKASRVSRKRQAEPASDGRHPPPRPRVETCCTERFDEACAAVESAASGLSKSSRLEFYALFKQATHGDCEVEEPSALNPVSHSKWSAWRAKKGMAIEDSKAAYVELALQLGVLHSSMKKGVSGGSRFGPVQSKPLMPDKHRDSTASKGDEFCCLAAEGNLEAIKDALSAEAALVNVTGEGRMTALHFAADRGHVDMVKLLINYGANVNHTDDCGETPLHVAIAAGQDDIVSVLLRAGADTSVKNNEGYSCAELLELGKACGE